jgi:SPP1 family predicted phage head-tail adaptor
MNPGLFRHRITFQSFSETTNENGFPVQDWTDIKTVWAMKKTLQGREYYQAAATQNENTVRWVIRYTKGLTPDMRIIDQNGQVYEIVSIINDDGRNTTLTIIAKEVM